MKKTILLLSALSLLAGCGEDDLPTSEELKAEEQKKMENELAKLYKLSDEKFNYHVTINIADSLNYIPFIAVKLNGQIHYSEFDDRYYPIDTAANVFVNNRIIHYTESEDKYRLKNCEKMNDETEIRENGKLYVFANKDLNGERVFYFLRTIDAKENVIKIDNTLLP